MAIKDKVYNDMQPQALYCFAVLFSLLAESGLSASETGGAAALCLTVCALGALTGNWCTKQSYSWVQKSHLQVALQVTAFGIGLLVAVLRSNHCFSMMQHMLICSLYWLLPNQASHPQAILAVQVAEIAGVAAIQLQAGQLDMFYRVASVLAVVLIGLVTPVALSVQTSPVTSGCSISDFQMAQQSGCSVSCQTEADSLVLQLLAMSLSPEPCSDMEVQVTDSETRPDSARQHARPGKGDSVASILSRPSFYELVVNAPLADPDDFQQIVEEIRVKRQSLESRRRGVMSFDSGSPADTATQGLNTLPRTFLSIHALPRRTQSFATIPERSRRLLELATITEGSEPLQDSQPQSTSSVSQQDISSTIGLLARSAYSDSDDEASSKVPLGLPSPFLLRQLGNQGQHESPQQSDGMRPSVRRARSTPLLMDGKSRRRRSSSNSPASSPSHRLRLGSGLLDQTAELLEPPGLPPAEQVDDSSSQHASGVYAVAGRPDKQLHQSTSSIDQPTWDLTAEQSCGVSNAALQAAHAHRGSMVAAVPAAPGAELELRSRRISDHTAAAVPPAGDQHRAEPSPVPAARASPQQSPPRSSVRSEGKPARRKSRFAATAGASGPSSGAESSEDAERVVRSGAGGSASQQPSLAELERYSTAPGTNSTSQMSEIISGASEASFSNLAVNSTGGKSGASMDSDSDAVNTRHAASRHTMQIANDSFVGRFASDSEDTLQPMFTVFEGAGRIRRRDKSISTDTKSLKVKYSSFNSTSSTKMPALVHRYSSHSDGEVECCHIRSTLPSCSKGLSSGVYASAANSVASLAHYEHNRMSQESLFGLWNMERTSFRRSTRVSDNSDTDNEAMRLAEILDLALPPQGDGTAVRRSGSFKFAPVPMPHVPGPSPLLQRIPLNSRWQLPTVPSESDEELLAAYSGASANESDLGGPDLPANRTTSSSQGSHHNSEQEGQLKAASDSQSSLQSSGSALSTRRSSGLDVAAAAAVDAVDIEARARASGSASSSCAQPATSARGQQPASAAALLKMLSVGRRSRGPSVRPREATIPEESVAGTHDTHDVDTQGQDGNLSSIDHEVQQEHPSWDKISGSSKDVSRPVSDAECDSMCDQMMLMSANGMEYRYSIANSSNMSVGAYGNESISPVMSRATSLRSHNLQRDASRVHWSRDSPQRQSSMVSRVGPSFAAAAVNQDSIEVKIEDCIVINRRGLESKKVLLDEIKIDKILGFGSMGMVYFGFLWDYKVVVKMIEHGQGVLGKEQNRGKLARAEASVSRMLTHPNVVITYDCCTGAMDAARLSKVSGTPGRSIGSAKGRQRQMTVMVQEFCELGTLKDALSKKKHGLNKSDPNFDAIVLQLLLDIANGMKYLHSLRIIHLDLKAENVLLQKASPTSNKSHGFVAKIADFGLAQVLPMDVDEARTGIHGTVSHMPPEAMRDPSFSLATDVYSFGIVVWEILTQESPFKGMAAHQVIEAVVDQGERPVFPSDVHEGMKELAEDCWETSPHNRPSFHDIVEKLRIMVNPNRDSRGAPAISAAQSDITDESDELELALRQQQRQQQQQQQQLGTSSALEAANVSYSGTHQTDSDTIITGPPKDQLGRMLYFLAQFPAVESTEKVQQPSGTMRWYISVDMKCTEATPSPQIQ